MQHKIARTFLQTLKYVKHQQTYINYKIKKFTIVTQTVHSTPVTAHRRNNFFHVVSIGKFRWVFLFCIHLCRAKLSICF